MRKLVVLLLRFYSQVLSFDRGILSVFAPGGACKYSPTCSAYAIQMVEKFGVIKGLGLGIKRILSCR